MGTLGCINDMMQRDKENRELRKIGKKRMSETHGRLLGLTGKRRSSDISPEKLEQIQAETEVRTAWEQKSYFRGKLIFITVVAVVSLLIWLVILWLS